MGESRLRCRRNLTGLCRGANFLSASLMGGRIVRAATFRPSIIVSHFPARFLARQVFSWKCSVREQSTVCRRVSATLTAHVVSPPHCVSSNSERNRRTHYPH